MPRIPRAAAITAALALTALAATGLPGAPASAAATDCTTTLWTSGQGGYSTYRIPALIRSGNVLVAFAEGRKNGAGDGGDIEIVSRRSLDGGCTWTPQQVISDDWFNTVDNPEPLLTSSGDLVLLTNWQSGDVTQAEIQAGTVPPEDGRRIYVQRSMDQGATWSARREITASVKDPDWRWYATGPGHGTTIRYGKAKGRLVATADHSTADTRGSHTLISDDSGQTWRLGAVDDHDDGVLLPDETTAAELPDASLYFSARQEFGTSPITRAYTYSRTSGSTFTAPFRPAPQIVIPKVEGSLLQDPPYPDGVTCHPLLLSAPEDPAVRQHLTIRRSDDSGASWRDIAELTGDTTPAAYSDMVQTSRTGIGIAYETGDATPYERIAWTRITLGCP